MVKTEVSWLQIRTRGYLVGGKGSTPDANIEYITIASEGDGIDFGDLTHTNGHRSSSSSTRGYLVVDSSFNQKNVIDYVEIQTLGNSIDFGDITTEDMVHGGLHLQQEEYSVVRR